MRVETEADANTEDLENVDSSKVKTPQWLTSASSSFGHSTVEEDLDQPETEMKGEREEQIMEERMNR